MERKLYASERLWDRRNGRVRSLSFGPHPPFLFGLALPFPPFSPREIASRVTEEGTDGHDGEEGGRWEGVGDEKKSWQTRGRGVGAQVQYR